MSFFRRPHQLLLRRINFQIHLWAGLLLALYATVIGVSGSILVFSAQHDSVVPRGGPRTGLNTLVANLRLRYPRTHVISLMAPTKAQPAFIAILQKFPPITVACDPATGRVLTELHRRQTALSWLADLHENLLAKRSGRVANGIAAFALLLLVSTGLVNWWRGIGNWRRGLTVDFRRKWRRINFDLHSAIGFWTVLFLLMWAMTGLYLVWPDDAAQMIARLSPITNSRPPAVTVDSSVEPIRLDFEAVVQRALHLSMGSQFEGILFPSSRRSPVQVLMTYSPVNAHDREDILYFDPYTGRYLATWHRGLNTTVGEWILWLQVPLHLGNHWGLAIKLLWATFGLALPALAITGLLMYWNRFLSKQWRRHDPLRPLSEGMQESTDAEAKTAY